jgi:hypothetical protein
MTLIDSLVHHRKPRLNPLQNGHMRNLVRKLGFSMWAISLGYWAAKQSAREFNDIEILLRRKIIERKARRKLVQRLLRQ